MTQPAATLPYNPDALEPMGRIMDLSAEGWTVWDCSPIFGPDGKVHLFSTAWLPSDPNQPDQTWFLGSRVIHSVADRPEGPYQQRDIVLDTDGSARAWDSSGIINPKIYGLRDGRYALVYTGCTDSKHFTQAVGMLVADSLDGPWRKVAVDRPLIAPADDRGGYDGYICNNPALLEHPDGRFWIYYKGRNVGDWTDQGHPLPGGMKICLATADRLEGPYEKHPANPLIDPTPHLFEDPYVWHQDGAFWMLCSDMDLKSHGGLLFRSDDGLRWEDPVIGYPEARSFTGHEQRLEEPNVLFKDGKPAYIFNILGACDADRAYSGHVLRVR